MLHTFAFDEVSGVVAGLLSKVINVTFAPTESGNFYRRVICLVQHQMPLFIDLIGSVGDKPDAIVGSSAVSLSAWRIAVAKCPPPRGHALTAVEAAPRRAECSGLTRSLLPC